MRHIIPYGLLAAILVACGGAADKPDTAATQTRTTELAVLASVEAAPTATATMVATSTVAPTNTPAATATEDASAYLDGVTETSQRALEIMQDMGALATDAAPLDPTWVQKVHDLEPRMAKVHDDVRDLDPPAAYLDSYQHYLDGVSLADEGISKFVRGVDALDADMISDAASILERATDEITKAVKTTPGA